jgi:hypothetical protein
MSSEVLRSTKTEDLRALLVEIQLELERRVREGEPHGKPERASAEQPQSNLLEDAVKRRK